MKPVLKLLVIACCLTGCATVTTTRQKADERERIFAEISHSVQNKKYTMEFNYVTPMTFTPHFLTSNYSVQVDGDSLRSFLPFFGRAYRADTYGDNKSPLCFDGPILYYTVDKKKKKKLRVELKTQHHSDYLTYYIEIFEDGKVSLSVTSSNRETINFSGNLVRKE